MRFLIVLMAVAGLSACASPALNMPNEQIRAMGDDQLCSLQNNYRSEPRVNAEIAARGLNCDRYFRECLRRGNKPQTESMNFCMDLLRENERLRYESDFDDFDHFGHRHGGIHSGIGVGFGF